MIRKCLISCAAILLLAAPSFAQSFSTPYTPGTPDVETLVEFYSGATDETAGPTHARAIAAGTEIAPTAPTTVSGLGPVAHNIFTYTAATSGLHNFFSAQDYDGYLMVYEGSLDPLDSLINALGGDDDMTSLNGGGVIDRGGVGGTSDSGVQLNLDAGTTYEIVTSGFSAGDFGNFYNEIYEVTPGTPATPEFVISDALAPVEIDLLITDPSQILSLDSVTITNLSHTFMGDLTISLENLATGTSVVLLDGVGGTDEFDGDYTFVDSGGDDIVAATGTVPSGTYDLNPGTGGALADFAGEDVAGTWRLTVTDSAGGDDGIVSAFTLNFTLTAIPEPSSATLLLLGMLGFACRRKA